MKKFACVVIGLVICFVYVGGVLSVPTDVVNTAQSRVDRINKAVYGNQ